VTTLDIASHPVVVTGGSLPGGLGVLDPGSGALYVECLTIDPSAAGDEVPTLPVGVAVEYQAGDERRSLNLPPARSHSVAVALPGATPGGVVATAAVSTPDGVVQVGVAELDLAGPGRRSGADWDGGARTLTWRKGHTYSSVERGAQTGNGNGGVVVRASLGGLGIESARVQGCDSFALDTAVFVTRLGAPVRLELAASSQTLDTARGVVTTVAEASGGAQGVLVTCEISPVARHPACLLLSYGAAQPGAAAPLPLRVEHRLSPPGGAGEGCEYDLSLLGSVQVFSGRRGPTGAAGWRTGAATACAIVHVGGGADVTGFTSLRNGSAATCAVGCGASFRTVVAYWSASSARVALARCKQAALSAAAAIGRGEPVLGDSPDGFVIDGLPDGFVVDGASDTGTAGGAGLRDASRLACFSQHVLRTSRSADCLASPGFALAAAPALLLLRPDSGVEIAAEAARLRETAATCAVAYGLRGVLYLPDEDAGSAPLPEWDTDGAAPLYHSCLVAGAVWDCFRLTGDRAWLLAEAWGVLRGVGDLASSAVLSGRLASCRSMDGASSGGAASLLSVRRALAGAIAAAFELGIGPMRPWEDAIGSPTLNPPVGADGALLGAAGGSWSERIAALLPPLSDALPTPPTPGSPGGGPCGWGSVVRATVAAALAAAGPSGVAGAPGLWLASALAVTARLESDPDIAAALADAALEQLLRAAAGGGIARDIWGPVDPGACGAVVVYLLCGVCGFRVVGGITEDYALDKSDRVPMPTGWRRIVFTAGGRGFPVYGRAAP
jgi:hypothetical protein